jgi:hypothetical protein
MRDRVKTKSLRLLGSTLLALAACAGPGSGEERYLVLHSDRYT